MPSARPATRWLGRGRTAQRLGPSDARSHHRALVLQALYRGRGLSRADLSRDLGLSRVTISDVVADLVEEDLVVELGTRPAARPGLFHNRPGRTMDPCACSPSSPEAMATVSSWKLAEFGC